MGSSPIDTFDKIPPSRGSGSELGLPHLLPFFTRQQPRGRPLPWAALPHGLRLRPQARATTLSCPAAPPPRRSTPWPPLPRGKVPSASSRGGSSVLRSAWAAPSQSRCISGPLSPRAGAAASLRVVPMHQAFDRPGLPPRRHSRPQPSRGTAPRELDAS